MNLSPKLLGFVRTVAGVALWGSLSAILSYFSDATHLNGVMNTTLAAVIAGLVGTIEHQMEANGKGAMFGAVRPRQ